CLSNLKQVGMATRMYSQDYDEVLVPLYLDRVRESGGTLPFGPRVTELYPDLLQPYVKNSDVFVCPNWSGIRTSGREWMPPGVGAGKQQLKYSYGGNNWHWWPGGQSQAPDLLGVMGVNRPGLSINAAETSVQYPASTIYMVDAVSWEIYT